MIKKILLSVFSVFFFSMLFADEPNLGLKGVKFAKDLGGYRIGDKMVRPDQLIRSSDLSKATEADLAVLEDSLHVSMVIDLRTTTELLVAQDNMPNNCLYINLPCLEQQVSNSTSYIRNENTYAANDEKELAELYLDSIGNRKVAQLANVLYSLIVRTRSVQEQIGEVLDSLTVLPEGQSAIIHCTNGKDRAGWVSVFVLAALGADRETLVSEFMSISEYLQPYLDYIIPKAEERGCDEKQISVLRALVGVDQTRFEETLDMIDQRYGSMEEYLTKQLKVDEEQRAKLRERFLSDAASS